MTVELTPEQHASIQAFVRGGAFKDETEVIDEALKSLHDREELRRKLQEGIDDLENGRYTEYGEDELDKLMNNIAALDEQRSADRRRRTG